MGTFFIYILKSAVCLVLFYLFFRLLLSKETFHRFNRIALLGVLCLSWLIPWIEVTTSHRIEVNQTVMTIEQLLMMAGTEASSVGTGAISVEAPTVSWIQIVLFIYLIGILFFVCRNIYSLGCLINILFSGKREKMEKGIILVVHEKEIAPFSWMKYIVISRKDLEENGREILIHEMAHIRNRHSIDLLVADICIFFQWFNPGAWLLKQELQNIHEYEADETVINEGVNAKEYQLLLIKKAVGTRLYSMANSFNHSKLKKRITMMSKEKSSPWARMKYLYVLPLAAIAVTVFARPEVSKTMEEISAVKVNDLEAIVETKAKEITEVTTSAVIPKDSLKEKKTPRDLEEAIVTVTGRASGVVGEDSVVVVGYGANFKTKNGTQKPLVFVNGIEAVGEDPLGKINPDRIQSVTVFKSKDAVTIYGDKGKNGVLKVQLLPSDSVRSNTVITQSKVEKLFDLPKSSPFSIRGVKVNGGIVGQPLLIIDGKEVFGNDVLSEISPDRIESISVLKDKASTAIYGDKGKNGVILVTLLTEGEYQAKKGKTPKSNADASEADVVIVRGTVKYVDSKPVIGATVVIKGTSNGTVSDADGNFVMKTPKDAELQISYIDMVTVTVKADSQVTVTLKKE